MKRRSYPIKGTSCYCCSTTLGLSDHHILARADGGTDARLNRVTLCQKCHDEIEGQDWQQIERRRERRQIERVTLMEKRRSYTRDLPKGECWGRSGLIWGRDESGIIYSRTPEDYEIHPSKPLPKIDPAMERPSLAA